MIETNKIYNKVDDSSKLLGLPKEFLLEKIQSKQIPFLTIDKTYYLDIEAVRNTLNQFSHINSNVLEWKVGRLDFNARIIYCLKRANIITVEDLISQSRYDLLRLRNFGASSIREVEHVLLNYNLTLS